tara:strand:+ start:5964 stop:6428 length:465 start_codon:yes stop_codon:yes gene_type:complete
MKKKSVLISSFHHKELQKLSEANSLSYYKLVEEMIIYFKKTGINPREPKNESPVKALKELDKRMVSFLRAQERDILKPLREEVYNYSKDQNREIQKVASEIIRIREQLNNHERKRTEMTLEELKKQRKGILVIAQLIDTRNKSGILGKINKIFE